MFLLVIYCSYIFLTLVFLVIFYSYFHSRYEHALAMWFAQLNLLKYNQY